MMRAAAFAIVAGLTFSASSESISISGTITGDGAPVSGARVSLKSKPEIVTYTNTSGSFSLNNTAVLHQQKTVSSLFATVKIQSNTITISPTENFNSADFSLFDFSGKKILSKKFSNVAGHSLTVPLNRMSTQISLLQLNINNQRYTLKCLDGASMNLFTTASTASRSSGNLQKNAASESYIDSIIITARSWKNCIIPISSYEQTITKELTASNPWKPTGNLTHEKGMVKILAKGYDFEMGQAEVTHVDDSVYSEQPVHTVAFTHDFWMDTAEVTQKVFDDLVKKYYPSYQIPSSRSARYGVGDYIPVYYIYWEDAVMYCNMKSRDEGLDTVYTYESIDGIPGEMCTLNGVTSDITKNGYRLPTEAEWEYACRGGTTTDYYWNKNCSPSYPSSSEDTVEISRYAVWDANSENNGEDNTGYGIHEIATTRPNSYGLYDMAGNVSEHVHDAETMEYSYGTVTDPDGPDDGVIHMVRGGNWSNNALYLRSASRNLNVVSYPYFCVGFRTVKTIQ